MAPTNCIRAAIQNTGNHRPPDFTTISAVNGPQAIPAIVAIVLEMPKVMALKLGAMSK